MSASAMLGSLASAAASNGTSADEFGLGLGACGVATLFFGSMFVPLAGFNNGDGFYTQWTMAVGVWLVGLAVQCARGFPKFYPLAMVGGVLWSAGNATAIPIINEIGMALGVLMWNLMNLILGWSTGRFGMFGWLNAEPPGSDALNGVGLALAIISTVMFGFVESRRPEQKVKSEGLERLEEETEADRDALVVRVQTPSPPSFKRTIAALEENEETASLDSVSADVTRLLPRISSRRLFAYALSLVAGCFYGLTFAPVLHIIDKVPGASQNGLDYVFAHYCGILTTSTIFFVVYATYKQNRPFINPRATLPGICGGILWGIAQSAWFVANDKLQESISFPIITRFPGIVCALWGVIYFKEITGKRNYILLSAAILVTVIGGIFSGLSSIL